MELSELIGLLKYEIQKSYDFSTNLARKDIDDNTSVINIELEKIEFDLPLLLTEKEVEFNRADKKHQGLPKFAKLFRMPFLPERLSNIPAGRVPKGTIKGRIIDVDLIGPTENIDDSITKEIITRMKIVLKPVLK